MTCIVCDAYAADLGQARHELAQARADNIELATLVQRLRDGLLRIRPELAQIGADLAKIEVDLAGVRP